MKVKYDPYLDGDEPQSNQENEKLRALCVAQEVEIARLYSGFDELKEQCSGWVKTKEDSHFGGYSSAMNFMLDEINRITGAD